MSNQDVYAKVNERILAKIEAGVCPWRHPWSTFAPQNAISKKPYRGINPFLLDNMAYQDHRWLTFQQAKELGGNVKKGEKASMIVFWTKTGRRKGVNDEGESVTIIKEYAAPIVRMIYVFNAEQCEGLKLPAVKPFDNAELPTVQSIIDNMPNPPKFLTAGKAAYAPKLDTVFMPALEKFISSEAHGSVLYHELIHSTGHPSRLGRFKFDEPHARFGSESYSKEELCAEMGAAMLCAVTGIENEATFSNSAAYLDGWSKRIKEDPYMFIGAASAAQKAADCILGIESTYDSVQAE